MVRLLSRFTIPAILLFIVAGLDMTATAFYQGLQVEQPPLLSFLMWISARWVMGWWLTNDLERRQVTWFYCPGLLLTIAWPFVLAYYLFKTRGWRAFIPIAAFCAVSLAAAVIALTISVALTIE